MVAFLLDLWHKYCPNYFSFKMTRSDCIHFRGEKPCLFLRSCENCPHFKPFPTKILIIKCRAMGDVLRTTSLLTGLKRKYPQSFISWVVDEESQELLLDNPYIDRVIPFRFGNVLPLLVEKFDVLLSLDKEAESISLATKIASPQKLGFGMNEHGNLIVFNKSAEYAYELGINDDLKFRHNRKTYQEIIYDISEIRYQDDKYVFLLREGSQKKAVEFFKKRRIPKHRLAIGLNTGAGTKFETKQWPFEYFQQLTKLITLKLKANVFLLGGKKEKVMNRTLAQKLKKQVYDTGHNNSLLEFAGFISLMDAVVSSDSLGMHLAIALGKKVIALFGPTCPQEVSLYGQGAKLFAGVPCSPCYKPACPDLKCMKAITPEQVFNEIKKIL